MGGAQRAGGLLHDVVFLKASARQHQIFSLTLLRARAYKDFEKSQLSFKLVIPTGPSVVHWLKASLLEILPEQGLPLPYPAIPTLSQRAA